MEKVYIRSLRFTEGSKKGHCGFSERFRKLYELSEITIDKLKEHFLLLSKPWGSAIKN